MSLITYKFKARPYADEKLESAMQWLIPNVGKYIGKSNNMTLSHTLWGDWIDQIERECDITPGFHVAQAFKVEGEGWQIYFVQEARPVTSEPDHYISFERIYSIFIDVADVASAVYCKLACS
jgi:hypothetical protein